MKVAGHARCVAFQMTEVSIPRKLFADIVRMIAELRPPPITSTAQCVPMSCVQSKTRGEVRLDEGEFGVLLLTNPRQRLDTGRRLAGVGNGLSKSQNNCRFSLLPASIWRMSDELT